MLQKEMLQLCCETVFVFPKAFPISSLELKFISDIKVVGEGKLHQTDRSSSKAKN